MMNIKPDGDIVELTLPARPEYVGVARLLVSGIANRLGFPYDDIEDIKLCVAEACTNAVRYAYMEGTEGTVFIRCIVFLDRLQVIVADQGGSFDIDSLKGTLGPIDKHMNLEEMSEGGLGLYLIHTLMDEVEISGVNGVTVAMTKYVRQDEVADHVEKTTESGNQ